MTIYFKSVEDHANTLIYFEFNFVLKIDKPFNMVQLDSKPLKTVQ